jgi:hypothetical protein
MTTPTSDDETNVISLFSPKSFPFGLLGNGAYVPFSIGGGLRRRDYQCVTEFVYAGLYDDVRYLDAMIGNWSRDAYANAQRVVWDIITGILRGGIADGMAFRFAADDAARARIVAITTPHIAIDRGQIGRQASAAEPIGRQASAAEPIGFAAAGDDDGGLTTTIETAINSVRFRDKARVGAIPMRELNDVINAVDAAMSRTIGRQASAAKPIGTHATIQAAAAQEAYVDALTHRSYDELKREFFPTAGRSAGLFATPARPDVIALLNGDANRIGAALRRLTFDALYARRVAVFKPHLLDVHLDYVLERDYPHIPPESYALAKQQQIVREGAAAVADMETTLVRMYENDELDADITDRLLFTPQTARAFRESEEAADRLRGAAAAANADDVAATTYLQYTDELMPWHARAIFVDGITWPTVAHYAYARAYRFLGATDGTFASVGATYAFVGATDAAYVNAAPDYDTLRARFRRDLSENFRMRATTRCSLAIHTKFVEREDDALRYLLAATIRYDDNVPEEETNTTRIIWFDKTDPILGVGADGRGANAAGAMIEDARARNERRVRVVYDAARFDYNLAANTVFRFWLTDLAADMYNATLTLRNTSVRELRIIYGYVTMAPLDRVEMSDGERADLTRVGFDDRTMKNVWPFVRTDWQLDLRELNEREAIERLVATRASSRRPTDVERSAAERYLTDAHARVHSSIDSPARFARCILGNVYVAPGDDRPDGDRWWRVIHWATLTMPTI